MRAAGRTRSREAELTFLRLVPGDSPVHRLWAGTKLLLAMELAIAGSIAPTWFTLAVLAALVTVGLLAAGIPVGALPRLPRFVYVLLALGLAIDALATTTPVVHVGPVPVSIGALVEGIRFLALAVVLILSAALVGWTTPLGAVAPALARLARPLRWLRLPVDEWVVAVALALRCLPLLADELRTLAAVRRLRRAEVGAGRRSRRLQARRAMVEVQDLVATAIIVSTRRARDLADAITARGGIGAVGDAADGRFGRRDLVALLVVTTVLTATLLAGRTV